MGGSLVVFSDTHISMQLAGDSEHGSILSTQKSVLHGMTQKMMCYYD